MSYIINKSDGSFLIALDDGIINQTDTSLTLIGKNSSAWGEFINENFLHLLESFAGTEPPANPIEGQLWYDVTEGRLKVHDGNSFKVSGGTIVSPTVPVSLTQGDIWIDNAGKQIHFYDGENRILAGPIYTASQGVSGFVVEDIQDNYGVSHTIMKLYISQILIGIYSKDQFTPNSSIAGYTGDINIGFNVSNYPNTSYNVTATKALSLVAGDGSLKGADSFLKTTENSTTSGSITIQNSIPLILGPNQNIEIDVSVDRCNISSTISSQDFAINTLNINGIKSALFVNAQNENVGIYTSNPLATLDVNGNTIIRGNLTVEGNTTSINTTNIEIEDLLIELGKVSSPNNGTATGGGISIEGGLDGDKTWTWQSTTAAWTSSENIDLASGKSYYVNGFEVISQTALGSSITSAPGLNSIGALTTLQVSNLTFSSPASISYVSVDPLPGDIKLIPKGTGSVDVNNSKIKNLANPVAGTDAVNFQTLSETVRTKPLAFYADTTGLSDGLIGSSILDRVYPGDDFDDGTVCRIMCIDGATTTFKLYTMTNSLWSFTGNL